MWYLGEKSIGKNTHKSMGLHYHMTDPQKVRQIRKEILSAAFTIKCLLAVVFSSAVNQFKDNNITVSRFSLYFPSLHGN